MLALDGFNGTTKWKTDIGSVTTSPAIASDGTLFVGINHILYALQGAGPLDPGPWTKYLGNSANSGVGKGVLRKPVLRPQRDADGVRIDFYGAIGGTFLIERSDQVGNGAKWEPWLNITVQESPTAILDLGARSRAARFFRVRNH